MPNDPMARALPLIERISRAAPAPENWTDFVDALAAELGDAALGITLDFPNSPGSTLAYSANIIASRDRRPLAGMGIFRRNGCRALVDSDLQLLGLLVPHLAQAYMVHEKSLGHRQRSDAISEAVDRFPTGMLLLDEKGCAVESNRAAKRVTDRDDGFGLREGRACAHHPSAIWGDAPIRC